MSFAHLPANNLHELKHDRDRFVAFAFASSDLLVELDGQQNIRYIDGATRGLLGDEAEQLTGKDFSVLVATDKLEYWQAIFTEIKETGRVQQRKMILSTRLFRRLPVALSGVILPSDSNSIFLSFSILRDEIDENEISGRDMITGLLNRDEYAHRSSKRLRELIEEGEDVKISLLDLPELQAFLQSLEPSKARELKLSIADYLRSQSVDSDMASMVEDGVYSFVHDSSVASDAVLQEVKQLITRLDPKMQSFKARLATLDGNLGTLNAEDSARAILYTLNRFANDEENFSFESLKDSYDSMLKETVERISQFKGVVEQESYQLAFQPIVDLRNGIIHHYEVLVRLQGMDESFQNPFHFVNFGEQTGLIHEFDLSMCKRALDVLNKAHEDTRWPVIAVNISGKSLSSQIFMDAMEKLCEQFPHVRRQLILEVTESAKIADMEVANRFLQQMRKRGHICCLDDFGVAESSFDYLRYLHVDYIKIDGSYVRENLNTTRGRHLLRAMVGMCRNLGMTTIGEMVEDEKTTAILWESGVHYGQGWLFGKPDTDETTLESWNLPCPSFKGMMRGG